MLRWIGRLVRGLVLLAVGLTVAFFAFAYFADPRSIAKNEAEARQLEASREALRASARRLWAELSGRPSDPPFSNAVVPPTAYTMYVQRGRVFGCRTPEQLAAFLRIDATDYPNGYKMTGPGQPCRRLFFDVAFRIVAREAGRIQVRPADDQQDIWISADAEIDEGTTWGR